MRILVLLTALVASVNAFAVDRQKVQEVVNGLVTGDNPYPGVAVIVVEDGKQYFYTAGSTEILGNSIVEIGSNTKVFTSLLLANAVVSGRLTLETKVNSALRESVLSDEVNKQMSLRHLSTHTSGLPRVPDNLKPADERNPYGDYDFHKLSEYAKRLSFLQPMPANCMAVGALDRVRTPGTCYDYSNTGVGLLGQAIAKSYEVDYEQLLRTQIFQDLKMSDTDTSVSEERMARVVKGYDWDNNETRLWTFKALAPTGAIKSTPNDMAKFLAFELAPTRSRLGRAAVLTQEMHADAPIVRSMPSQPDIRQKMGLGWHINDTKGEVIHWHNGATYGFSSFMGIDRKRKLAVFIVANQVKLTKDKTEIDSRIDQAGFKLIGRL